MSETTEITAREWQVRFMPRVRLHRREDIEDTVDFDDDSLTFLSNGTVRDAEGDYLVKLDDLR